MSDPSSTDDDLLARLNALKKSSVSFDTTRNSPITPASPPKPTDDLAVRFARLGSASPSGSPQPLRSGAPVIAPGAPSYLEGIAQGVGGSNIEFNEEDERSLEELLGELDGAVGDRKEWDVSKKEQADVGKLLQDMKRILPEVVNSRAQDTKNPVPQSAAGKEELTDWESIEVSIGSGGVDVGREDTTGQGEDEDGKKKTEDEEADDVIARFMAELDISKKYDPPSPPPKDDDSDSGDQEADSKARKEDTTDDGFTLPSAPTSLPEDDFAKTQAIEDAFTARLAALSAPSPSQTDSLGLPSAPSFSPRKKPPLASNLQERLDEEIDTWCIICQDDATLRCTGCDGDLYCQNCWMEGHRGESAGFEERRHKAVLYAKKKKQAAA